MGQGPTYVLTPSISMLNAYHVLRFIQLSKHLLSLSVHLTSSLTSALNFHNIPPTLASLHPSTTSHQNDPSPIIPILTPHPRPLSAYLLAHGMNARPITWPTVPKGKDRVRVCLHAGNTKEDVDRLVWSVVRWVQEVLNAGARKTNGNEVEYVQHMLERSKL